MYTECESREKGIGSMLTQYLKENWSLLTSLAEHPLPARVPGSVYADLLNGGVMEDPYFRDNELEALRIMDQDFVYQTSFSVLPQMLKSDEIILRFEGLDTIADVILNGKPIGHCENMHRIWEYSIKEELNESENQLKVVLHSPTDYIRKAYENSPLEGSGDAMRGFPYLRKAHCMFGWDWGARLPDAGIWRDVALLGVSTARIDSVYATQTHERGLVRLNLEVAVIMAHTKRSLSWKEQRGKQDGTADLSYRVKLTDPDGETRVFADSPTEIFIRNPKLWWPNGYGEQPLYTLAVELLHSGRILDCWERRIGLRTITVSREKDAWGEEFAQTINGVKMFAMGSDYIPEDSILARCSKERTDTLLAQAKAANHNTIRVWGGGIYPPDWFFDACDELGLLVWQDFMFACACYELTPEFEANVRAELADNIKRIRHHASLALWCGNNENESFTRTGTWVTHERQRAYYLMLNEYIIPQVLGRYDPNTFYWPSSPSSGGSFDDPNDPNRGDNHYWDVWHGDKPITEYRKFYFRYLSEFGFQSFPSLPTCRSFTLPEDRNIFSYVMEKHQRNASANAKIMSYMGQTFLYPTDFDTILYASQLLQAEAIRYGVEHFRRNRGRCMGTLVWQLNDCWPVASWSSIDYFGRWKALHYYEKRMFAPILLSCAEEGILTQDANPNAQPYEVAKSIHLNVSNETMQEQTVTVRWALRNAKAAVLEEEEQKITVPALSSVWLAQKDYPQAALYDHYVSYELVQNEALLSVGSVMFTVPKYFHFCDPHLTLQVCGGEIVVKAEAYARSVEIHNEDDTLLLEDNYFDLNGGERRVKIIKGNPTGLKVRSVYDIR